jgi:hypothetical protein
MLSQVGPAARQHQQQQQAVAASIRQLVMIPGYCCTQAAIHAGPASSTVGQQQGGTAARGCKAGCGRLHSGATD